MLCHGFKPQNMDEFCQASPYGLALAILLVLLRDEVETFIWGFNLVACPLLGNVLNHNCVNNMDMHCNMPVVICILLPHMCMA